LRRLISEYHTEVPMLRRVLTCLAVILSVTGVFAYAEVQRQADSGQGWLVNCPPKALEAVIDGFSSCAQSIRATLD